MHGEFGVMYVHRAVRKGVVQLPADVLAELHARQGEGLVGTAGLHLEAFGVQHLVPEIGFGKLHNGVLVLFAGGGTGDGHNAEDLLQLFKGGVHVGVLLRPLHIDGGLEDIGPEFADAAQTPADIAEQLLLEAPAVEALENDLADL